MKKSAFLGPHVGSLWHVARGNKNPSNVLNNDGDTVPSPRGGDISVARLKALMLLSVFVFHSSGVLEFIKTEPIVPAQFLRAFFEPMSWCLGAFFCISGYYTAIYGTRVQGYFDLLKRRSRTLLIPYLLWNSVYIVAFIAGPLLGAAFKGRRVQSGLFSFASVVDGVLGVTNYPADIPLWYIRNLFLCIMLYPLLKWFCRKHCGLPIILAMAIVLGVLHPFMPSVLADQYLKSYILPSFCLGVYFRERSISPHVFDRSPVLNIALALLMLFAKLNWICLPFTQWILERKLVYLAVLPFWLMLAKYLGSFEVDGTFDKFFVKPSFFIYASHALLGSAMVRIFAPIVPETPCKFFILAAVFLFGGGALICISSMLLSKCFPGIYALLTGGRK